MNNRSKPSRQSKLNWQSKLVLLLVLPFTAAGLVLQMHWWAINYWPVAVCAAGLSLLFGIVVLRLRAGTPAAAFTGAAITASLMFSTAAFTPAGAYPYAPWHTALLPVLAVFLLAYIATRIGRESKEQQGTAENRQGRTAAQVAANLGVATLVSSQPAQAWLVGNRWFTHAAPALLLAAGLAALAEAAADTVSSELGQALSLGQGWALGVPPRMITTLRPVAPGTDGAVSLLGTLAGVAAAMIVALAGSAALGGGAMMFWISAAGGVFGLFFDSLLGATLELQNRERQDQDGERLGWLNRNWLNNNAVNFLSTASAAAFAMGLLAVLTHLGRGSAP